MGKEGGGPERSFKLQVASLNDNNKSRGSRARSRAARGSAGPAVIIHSEPFKHVNTHGQGAAVECRLCMQVPCRDLGPNCK